MVTEGHSYWSKSNYGSILRQLRDKARYWSKIVIFYTPLHRSILYRLLAI